jgi:hypothetical protein
MRILYVENDEFDFRPVERVFAFDGHAVVRARLARARRPRTAQTWARPCGRGTP